MLKLTTDKHEAARGLSATAELLVFFLCQGHRLHYVWDLDQWGLKTRRSAQEVPFGGRNDVPLHFGD